MKISKKMFICALFVLMLLFCVNACSAEGTLNETLGADAGDIAVAADVSDVELSDSNDEILGGDDYGSDAVSTAAGDDTISTDDDKLSTSDESAIGADGDVIYVSTTGNDANDGSSEANAVATLKKAVDIANGKIIMLPGTYTETSLITIDKDLEIVGQGDVTINSNSRYTVEVWDDYWEEWETETHNVLIQNNAVLNLTNIKFTLTTASQSDQIINNTGTLYVNTCEFNNIKITSGRGVIQNVKGGKLEVRDTTFKTASGTYGAINNNGELLVDHCKFLDNDRSSDSGVYSTAITSYNKATILNSEFKNNKGTVGGAVYVMYSYTNKENPVMDIKNCTFENNVAPGTSYTDGTGGAVKCSGKQVTLNIEDSTFTGNSAKKGGAVYAEGNATFEDCVFHNNGQTPVSASMGEDVYVSSGSTATLIDCTVDDPSYVWGPSDATIIYATKPAASIIYVSTTGDDANDGSSRDKAVATVTKAVDLVPEGGTIYILNGNYTLHGNKAGEDNVGRLDVIYISKSVAFVGESTEGVILDANQGTFQFESENEIEFISFENLTIWRPYPEAAIWVSTGNELNVTNCKFTASECEDQVIWCEAEGLDVNIIGSYFECNNYAIYLCGSGNLEVHNSILLSNVYPIINEGGATGNIDNNYFGTNAKIDSMGLTLNNWVISTVTVNPTGDVETGDEVTIAVDFNTLTDGTANTTQTNLIPDYMTIRFTANGDLSDERVLIENGIVTSTYSSDAAMEDTVNIYNYAKKIASVPINVTAKEELTNSTNVYVNGTTITDGDNATLSILLTEEDGSIISAPVVVNVNGVNVTTVTTSDGGWLDVVVNASDLLLGTNNVTVYYDGDSTHKASNATATIEVEKNKKVTANVVVEDAVYGDPAVLKITDLQDAYGKKLSVYGGYQLVGPATPYGSIFVSKGSCTANLNNLPAGNYTAYIVFGNNAGGDYEFENYIVDFTVFKAPVNLTASVVDYDYRETGTLNVKVTDAKNRTIAGTINVAIDGVAYISDVAIDGESNIALEGLDVNNHTAEIIFDSDNYVQTTSTVTFNVIHNIIGTNLNASGLEMTFKDGSAWTVTLTDGTDPIEGAVVKVGILGKTYSLTTGADGTVSLPVNVAPGTYDVNATFEGDETYESAFVNATVTVGKAASTLTAEDMTLTYKNGSWIVTLTGAEGVIPKAAIKFGIMGKIYTLKTDENGVAALAINLAPNTYEVNATFEGNYKHESSFVSATVTVEKATVTLTAEDLTMCYKDGTAYEVTVTDANGAAVAGTTVKFTFGTKSYSIKTDENGVAALPINLNIGEYAVSVVVDDAKYTSEEATHTIAVTDYDAVLVANDINMTYQDGTSYDVQLTTADGTPIAVANLVVKITLGTKTYNIKTDADGIAKVPINLRAGNYTVTAEYNGAEITNTIVVKA